TWPVSLHAALPIAASGRAGAASNSAPSSPLAACSSRPARVRPPLPLVSAAERALPVCRVAIGDPPSLHGAERRLLRPFCSEYGHGKVRGHRPRGENPVGPK